MIQNETLVKIADNGGGTVGKVFKVLGSSKKRYATLGELVIISVKVASPRKTVKKKDVYQAVVVRTMPRELAEKGFQKIISLAQEVI